MLTGVKLADGTGDQGRITVLLSSRNGMPIFPRTAMTATALNGQLPQFIGSTGGLLNAAETEEKYAITWSSSNA